MNPGDEAITIYEEVAARLDQHSSTSAHNAFCERPATLSLLPDVNGKSVLDAGCGSGAYTQWLVKRGATVVAVDASQKMVDLTKKKMGSTVKALKNDLRMPLEFLDASSIDIVICALMLDYVEDLISVFAEFCRLLKPAGLLIFSIPHPFNEFSKRGTNYFSVEPIVTKFPALDVEMPSYRRPLASISDALYRTGFVLDRLIEPEPTIECEQVHPEAYEKLRTHPAFLCIKAHKKSLDDV